MEGLKVVLLVVLGLAATVHGLGIPPNRIYISYVDPSDGNWTSPASNWATEETVPREEIFPSTVDDVLINNHNEVTVTLGPNENRVVRTFTIGSGNALVIGPSSTLSTGPPTESSAGEFVDACDGLPTQCPIDFVQPEENQAFCISCALTGQVANDDQSECVFCPAGKVFNATLPAGMRCQNCSMFQDSDGMGSECRDCPAHFSSFGGEPCFPCPPPTDSHSGGPCVLCLPDLREEYCPWGFGATGECSGIGSCIEGLDPITGAEREICDCMGMGVGSNCGLSEEAGFKSVECTNGCTITIPFPFGFTRDVDATPTGPIINFSSTSGWIVEGDFSGSMTTAWRANNFGTDFAGLGLVDPNLSAPAGFETTPFGFELYAYDSLTNAPIQELYTPAQVVVPYDEFEVLANPWRLEVFYWNVIQQEWIQITRTCFGENDKRKREVERFGVKVVETQKGQVTFELYQVSVQFHVFLALPTTTEIPGTPDGVLGPNPLTPNTGNGFSGNFNGEARPPHITTGIAGVLPVPPVADPGRRPPEPNRKPLFTASAAASFSVSLPLLGAAILLFSLFI